MAAARPSRRVADILRENLLTRFNALLGSLLLVVLVIGPLRDAIFGLILVANAAIGIGQELRAKWTLDRLALLSAAPARAVRSGRTREIPAQEVVLGDLLEVAAGDQVIADGLVVRADELEVNEALLTGESEPVVKPTGTEVRSGSFVSAGSGRYVALRLGEAAHAGRLEAEARRFQLVRSELVIGINRILRLITWVIPPVGLILLVSQFRVQPTIPDALRGAVAGLVTLVPEGLVLLASVAMALAVVRLGRRRVLVQQLAAVEALARVDLVCMDKTGTLTEGGVALNRVEPLGDGSWPQALGALAHAEPRPDPSLAAVAAAHPAPPGWALRSRVAFSSTRKWSAATFEGHGSWVLGAPDVLLGPAKDGDDLGRRIAALAAGGSRVLLLAAAAADRAAGGGLPPGLQPAALVLLEERARASAAPVLAYLTEQGVAVKVISGDHPRTVAAALGRLGGDGAEPVLDAAGLPADPERLAEAVAAAAGVGRATPEQKRAIVQALRGRGHVVAMVGDGVNDVLALKAADIGLAMGPGAGAARAVAAVVLLDGSFDHLPAVIREGRRVITNIERLAGLFVTKSVYACLLAVAVGVTWLPFPFLPRHLTLIAGLTVGLPAAILTLSPDARRAVPGFIGRVFRFALPAGVVAAAATYAAYALALEERGVALDEARTTAALVLGAVALWILAILGRPLTAGRRWLIGLLALALGAATVVPTVRDFFALDLPSAVVLLAALGLVTLAVLTLEGMTRIISRWLRPPGARPETGRGP